LQCIRTFVNKNAPAVQIYVEIYSFSGRADANGDANVQPDFGFVRSEFWAGRF
jgi:hypothetical protein